MNLKTWTLNELNGNYLPLPRRVGDLKYNAHYSWRGIPFLIKMFRNKDNWYEIWLRVYDTIKGEWVDLAELDVMIEPNKIIELMNPFADKMVAAGQRVVWEKIS